MDFGLAVDVDVVAGVLVFQVGVDLLRVDQADDFLLAAVADADVGAAGHHPGLDFDVGGLAVDVADDRLAGLLDAVHAQAERFADHVDRLGEADVPDDRAIRDARPEVFGRGAHTLGFHHGRAIGAEVVDARGLDPLDGVAAAGEGDDQQVEHKAGVDAGAEHGHAVLFCEQVELEGELRVLGFGVGHLLGDRDAVDPGSDDLLQIGDLVPDPGGGRERDDVDLVFIQDGFGLIGDGHAQVFPEAEHLAEVLADEVGAAIDRGDDLQAGFFEHQAGHAAAHGSKSPLEDTNRLLHTLSPYRYRMNPSDHLSTRTVGNLVVNVRCLREGQADCSWILTRGARTAQSENLHLGTVRDVTSGRGNLVPFMGC